LCKNPQLVSMIQSLDVSLLLYSHFFKGETYNAKTLDNLSLGSYGTGGLFLFSLQQVKN
jgi:hypothetical protein